MKFRLRSAHYWTNDIWLPGDTELATQGDEKGTIVGDGTPYVVVWPTLEMIPLDEEAEAFLEKEVERLEINAKANLPEFEDLAMDQYEKGYVPGFNTRRGKPLPNGAPAVKK